MDNPQKDDNGTGLFSDKEIDKAIREKVLEIQVKRLQERIEKLANENGIHLQKDSATHEFNSSLLERKVLNVLIKELAQKETDLMIKDAQLDIIYRIANGSFIANLKEIQTTTI